MGIFQTVGSNARYGVLDAGSQRTVAAAGVSQTDATVLRDSDAVIVVTGASSSNGVVIPKAKVLGRQHLIYSSAATNALLIYPPVGGTINTGSTNASFSATARTPYYFTCTSGDGLTWIAK